MLNQSMSKNRRYSNQKLFDNFEYSNISTKSQLNKQHLKQTNYEENIRTDISSLFSSVGILRMNWYNNDILQTINYGSAFAVTNRILITCTHNIFSQRKRQFCSEVIFIPNINKQQIQLQPTYKSDKNKDPQTFYRCLTPKNTFNYQPLQEQLTLIVLQSPLQTNNFIKIGTIEKEQENKNKKLQIIGYPSKDYFEFANLNMVQSDRKVLSGNLYEIDHHIIKHTMKTSIGMSGSPILSQNDDGQYKAVGIHTHKGLEKQYNSGLFFNDKIIKQIKSFASRLTAAFNLNSHIKYIYKEGQEYNQNDQSSMQEMRNLNQSSLHTNIICFQSLIEGIIPHHHQNKDYFLQEKSSYDEQQEQSNFYLYSLEIPTPIKQSQLQSIIQFGQQKQNKTTRSQTNSIFSYLQSDFELQDYSRDEIIFQYSNCQSLQIDLLNLNIDPINHFEQKYNDDNLQNFMEYLQNIFEVNQFMKVISKFTTLTPKTSKIKQNSKNDKKQTKQNTSLQFNKCKINDFMFEYAQ